MTLNWDPVTEKNDPVGDPVAIKSDPVSDPVEAKSDPVSDPVADKCDPVCDPITLKWDPVSDSVTSMTHFVTSNRDPDSDSPSIFFENISLIHIPPYPNKK